MRPLCTTLLVAVLGATGASPALGTPLQTGAARGGQPGVAEVLSAIPSAPGSWVLHTDGQYGWTPSVLTDDDDRQRAATRFGLSYAPWRFLQLGLSADATVDTYATGEADGGSAVVGAVGDPRLTIRTGWTLGRGFHLGGLLGLWVPSGRGAFAVSGSAISPSIIAVASYAPDRLPLGVHLNVGYAHDRSLEMLGDVSTLAPQQLLLSGATSAAHQLTLGLGVEYRIGPAAPFVEVESDLALSGDGLASSPATVGVGARLWLGPGDAVQISLAGTFRVSPLPDAPNPAEGTLWSAPPLVNVMVSAAFRLPVRAPLARDGGAGGGSGGPDTTPCAETPSSAQQPGRLVGTVSCGDAPCGRGTTVTVAGTDTSPYAANPTTGAFRTAPIEPGTYRILAAAPGRNAEGAEVEIAGGETATVTFQLTPAETAERPGIRGRVTNFEGEPIAATVRIPALDVELTANAEGRFETDTDPGTYEVIVSQRGYRTQTIRVEVTAEGVVIMNVELRRRR